MSASHGSHRKNLEANQYCQNGSDCGPTAISYEIQRTGVEKNFSFFKKENLETSQYHQNKYKWYPMSLFHENHNNVTEFSLLGNSGLAKFTSAANCL